MIYHSVYKKVGYTFKFRDINNISYKRFTIFPVGYTFKFRGNNNLSFEWKLPTVVGYTFKFRGNNNWPHPFLFHRTVGYTFPLKGTYRVTISTDSYLSISIESNLSLCSVLSLGSSNRPDLYVNISKNLYSYTIIRIIF